MKIRRLFQLPESKYNWREIARWLWQALRGNRLQATLNAGIGLFGVGLSLLTVWAMQRAIDTASGVRSGSIYWALGHDAGFDGFANTVTYKAYKFSGKDRTEVDIHEDKKAKIDELHNAVLEAVAGTDDALLDKFFMGEEFTDEEVRTALRKGVMAGELVPVLVGSATKNIGLQTLLEMFLDYLPSPADLKPFEAHDDAGKEIIRKTDDSEPFSAYVFKTVVDPYSGVINLIKVNSGVLRSGDDVYVGNGTQRVSKESDMTE